MSRIEQARALLKEVPTRHLFVEAAMTQLGLSPSGANTYFQRLKNDERSAPLSPSYGLSPVVGLALYAAIF